MRLSIKGKEIRVNIDKADNYFDEVYAILKETKTVEQAIIKSKKDYNSLHSIYGSILDSITFMPIIKIKKRTTKEDLYHITSKKFPIYEITFKEINKEVMGYLRIITYRDSSLIWMNPIKAKYCANFDDKKALIDPHNSWGVLIDSLGADILQTDQVELMSRYLKSRNLNY